jgi:PKD repeat protein
MKNNYVLLFFLLLTFQIQAQTPCQLSLDDFYLDTTAGDCNHLFFKYAISGGTATKFFWTYGDGNSCTCIHPKNTYNQNGTFQVCGRIEDANGCVDSLCKSFTVNCSDPCQLSELGIFSVDTLSYTCDEVEFITITSSNTKKVKWDFGDGDSSDTKYVIHKYKSNGTYQVRLIINDSINCADTANLELTIDCPPVDTCDFQLSGLDTLPFKSANTKKFTINTNRPYKYLWWIYGDGISENGGEQTTHTYYIATDYTVCVIGEDSAGCTDTICLKVDIKAIDLINDIETSLVSDVYKYLIVTSDELSLELKTSCSFELLDASGKVVLSGSMTEGKQMVDIRTLSSGIYTLSLKTEMRLIHLKVFKP